MYKILLCYVFFFLMSTLPNVHLKMAQNCELDLNSLATNRQPLMFVKRKHEYELIIPESIRRESVILLDEKENCLLICPGKDNKLETLDEDVISAKCSNHELLFDSGLNIVGDQQCTKKPKPELKKTGVACGEKLLGEYFEAGYQIDELNKWISFFKVCHDIENMNTFHSIHTLRGNAINTRQVNIPRPEFMIGNSEIFYRAIQPNKLYTKIKEVETIRTILKSYDVSAFIDTNHKYLSRGHLTPDADMPLSSWKIVTYLLINTAPQWQSINGSSWKRVEHVTRTAAVELQDDLTIVTGTLGIMTLPNGNRPENIYLASDKKLRVPGHFWKIIYQEKTKKAIVIITSNNPYNENIKFLCEDICAKYKWPLTFTEISKGFTYCCKYEEFKNLVEIPKLEVTDTLEYPVKTPLEKFRWAVNKVIQNSKKLKGKNKKN